MRTEYAALSLKVGIVCPTLPSLFLALLYLRLMWDTQKMNSTEKGCAVLVYVSLLVFGDYLRTHQSELMKTVRK